MSPTKYCTSCEVLKPLSHFQANSKVKCGVQGTCKECVAKKQKELRDNKTKQIMRDSMVDYRDEIMKELNKEKSQESEVVSIMPDNFLSSKIFNRGWQPTTRGWFTAAELGSARIKP